MVGFSTFYKTPGLYKFVGTYFTPFIVSFLVRKLTIGLECEVNKTDQVKTENIVNLSLFGRFFHTNLPLLS